VRIVIGAIADDFTGATDVAAAFRRQGLRTLLFFGTPGGHVDLPPHDAIVVAEKTRTVPSELAVASSVHAVKWLQDQGANRFYFKYCSTFDSGPAGNIGPVLDALSDALSAGEVLQTPSSPEHRRTQYLGYLFVEDLLLAESHMRNHPLTPMKDSLLKRVLGAQTAYEVVTIPLETVRNGATAVRKAVADARVAGARYMLADAISPDDLFILGRAALDYPLVAGASGLAGGLALAIVAAGAPAAEEADDDLARSWPAVVLSGSCSSRTLEQLAVLRNAGRAMYRLDALADQNPTSLADGALAWYDSVPDSTAPVIYSSLPAQELSAVQAELGVERSADILETAMGLAARGLVARGVRRIISSGGETSGAIATALGIGGGRIGPEAATGVPWIYADGPTPVALLLKSGNFGEPELLASASSRTVVLANS
jgi:3-dehydrotetronate 4-kinase